MNTSALNAWVVSVFLYFTSLKILLSLFPNPMLESRFIKKITRVIYTAHHLYCSYPVAADYAEIEESQFCQCRNFKKNVPVAM